MADSTPTRLVPDRQLPPYSYVPGQHPHPNSDPAGHSFGEAPPGAERLDLTNWNNNVEYLWGIDLFNQGYYWEAHEAWEAVWIASGRTTQEAQFVQGLIKLAAAGVKLSEGNPRGVTRHVARSRELLRGAALQEKSIAGISLSQLIAIGDEMCQVAATLEAPASRGRFVIEVSPSQRRQA